MLSYSGQLNSRVLLLLVDISFVVSQIDVAFPIKDFLLNSTEETTNLFDQYLCKGDTRKRGLFCCGCRDYCFRSQTCCSDVLWNRQKPLPVAQYLQTFNNEVNKYKPMECEPAFPLAIKKGERSNRYFMVTTCLEGASIEDINGCSNVEDKESYKYVVPVFGEDNYLYKNAFCAKCNFITRYETLNIKGQCRRGTVPRIARPRSFSPGVATTTTPKPAVPLSQMFTDCTYDILTTNPKFKFPNLLRCDSKKTRTRSSCKNKSSQYYKLCHNHYAIASDYANYYCYLCEKEDIPTLVPPRFTCPYNRAGRGIFRWSFTLSFQEETKVTITGPRDSEQTFCSNGEQLNIFTGNCDSFSCTTGFQKNGSSCIKTTDSKIHVQITNPSFDKCLLTKTPAIVAVFNYNSTNHTEIIKKQFNITSENKIREIYKSNNKSYIKIEYNITNITYFYDHVIPSYSNIWHDIEQIYVGKNDLYGFYVTDLINIDFLRSFDGPRICANVNEIANFTSNFTNACNFLHKNESFAPENVTQLILYERYNVTRKVATCKQFYHHSPCKLTTFNDSYSILDNLTLIIENKLYTPSEYIPLKNGVGVCITKDELQYKSLRTYEWKETTHDVEYYIGVILTPISILCYIFIIFVHLYFKEFRNDLTKVGLCVTLLLTDVTYLVASHIENNYSACKASSIILHWLLLATQCWVIIMAFNLLSKFGSLGKRGTEKSFKSLVYYTFFVIFTASLITLTLFILDKTNTYKAGYGLNGVCFINRLYPRIYFYIIPVSLSIVFTFTVFIRSVMAIVNKEKQIRQVLADSDRKKNNLIIITLKLVIVLGLIEIVGLIQIQKDTLNEKELIFNTVFGILFTLLRSIRGILLVFVFIFSERKLSVIKDSWVATKGKQRNEAIELPISQIKANQDNQKS